MSTYGELLGRLRERRAVSQRALARDLGISHTLVVRSEAGVRSPAGPDEVLRIAGLLGLAPEETDELLLSAGYWPAVFIALGPAEPTLRRVAEALARVRDDAGAARRLRAALAAVADLAAPLGRDRAPGG